MTFILSIYDNRMSFLKSSDTIMMGTYDSNIWVSYPTNNETK